MRDTDWQDLDDEALERLLVERWLYRGILLGVLLRITPEAMCKAMLERSPLKRMVRASDISSAAAFLCSPAARNISGQVLAVNAGEPAG